MRLAVIGHVEHVTLGRVPELPGEGGIVHLGDVRIFPGGGGGIAFFQLVKSSAELHLFTALGNDLAAADIEARLAQTGARIHAARRAEPQTRDLVLLPPSGDRAIVVVGEPLHVRLEDPLPWEVLSTCDAVYFTGQDPRVLAKARGARVLVATARRRAAILASAVPIDVVVGSALDPREISMPADFDAQALVMTEGERGGTVATAGGVERFAAPRVAAAGGGAYGAGDSFAAALTYWVAAGFPLREACARASLHGAAVLSGTNPLEHQLALP